MVKVLRLRIKMLLVLLFCDRRASSVLEANKLGSASFKANPQHQATGEVRVQFRLSCVHRLGAPSMHGDDWSEVSQAEFVQYTPEL